MADVDVNPFGDHDKTDSHSDDTGENIPLPPVNPGEGGTWEPEREQGTSFGGRKTQERRVTDSYFNSLYKELSLHYSQTLVATHYDNFRREGKQLYFKDRDEPLTNEDGKLKTFGKLKSISSKNRLHDLGFDVPSSKSTPQQSVILYKAEEEMPSTSDVEKANDIELQEIMDNVARSTDNLIKQLEGGSSEDLQMRELFGLDKQLRRIRGSLRVEVAKSFSWKKKSVEKSVSLKKSGTIQNTTMVFKKRLGT